MITEKEKQILSNISHIMPVDVYGDFSLCLNTWQESDFYEMVNKAFEHCYGENGCLLPIQVPIQQQEKKSIADLHLDYGYTVVGMIYDICSLVGEYLYNIERHPNHLLFTFRSSRTLVITYAGDISFFDETNSPVSLGKKKDEILALINSRYKFLS